MARKSSLRRRFDRKIKARLLQEHGRDDAVKWLAWQMKTSEGYVSQMLDNKTPRRNHHGEEFNTWKRLKAHLTAGEIALLEAMETASDD